MQERIGRTKNCRTTCDTTRPQNHANQRHLTKQSNLAAATQKERGKRRHHSTLGKTTATIVNHGETLYLGEWGGHDSESSTTGQSSDRGKCDQEQRRDRRDGGNKRFQLTTCAGSLFATRIEEGEECNRPCPGGGGQPCHLF
jgi:hypothetical protein